MNEWIDQNQKLPELEKTVEVCGMIRTTAKLLCADPILWGPSEDAKHVIDLRVWRECESIGDNATAPANTEAVAAEGEG